MAALGVHRSGVEVNSRYRDFENVSGSRSTRRRESIPSGAWKEWGGYQAWSQSEWNWDSWRGDRDHRG